MEYVELNMPAQLEDKDLKRFWSKVLKTRTCWEWRGHKTTKGYGRFWLKGKTRMAHRISFIVENSKLIPVGKVIMHSCDNPSCVKPAHLVLGTQKQNVNDCFSRNRRSPIKGSQHSNSKLTELEVVKIRKLYNTGTISQYDIAKRFNVSRSLIRNIVTKVSRKNNSNKVYVVYYSNYFEEEWYIKRGFSTIEKAKSYVQGYNPVGQFAKLSIKEVDIL